MLIFGAFAILSTSACTPGLPRWGEVTPYPTLTIKPTLTLIPSASPTATPTPILTVEAPPTVETSPPETPASIPAETSTPTENVPPSATPFACWSKGGYLEQKSIISPELEHPLEFQVYLPPCYYHYPEKHYPVLYLLHGLYYSDNQWVRMGLVNTANELMAAGEIPPFIIILPRDQDWSLPPTNKFGEVLVFELVLWVDNNYRTIPGSEFRAIGGLSRGGNWAIHIVLQYWGMFGALGAHSAPVFYTDGLKIPRWLDEIPPEKMPRIFLDIGEDDGDGKYMHSFEGMLTKRNIPHEWHLNPGTHNEEYWSSHLEQYLRWYSDAWREDSEG